MAVKFQEQTPEKKLESETLCSPVQESGGHKSSTKTWKAPGSSPLGLPNGLRHLYSEMEEIPPPKQEHYTPYATTAKEGDDSGRAGQQNEADQTCPGDNEGTPYTTTTDKADEEARAFQRNEDGENASTFGKERPLPTQAKKEDGNGCSRSPGRYGERVKRKRNVTIAPVRRSRSYAKKAATFFMIALLTSRNGLANSAVAPHRDGLHCIICCAERCSEKLQRIYVSSKDTPLWERGTKGIQSCDQTCLEQFTPCCYNDRVFLPVPSSTNQFDFEETEKTLVTNTTTCPSLHEYISSSKTELWGMSVIIIIAVIVGGMLI